VSSISIKQQAIQIPISRLSPKLGKNAKVIKTINAK
jgi:hypothetical protein